MTKKMKIAIAVACLLIIYIIISNINFSKGLPNAPHWSDEPNEITINTISSKLLIKNIGSKWTVSDEKFPANQQIVNEMVMRLKNIRITDHISSQKYYSRYDLIAEKTTEVIVKDGKNNLLRRFRFGKKNPTQKHTYVMIDDKPEIYLAEGTYDDLSKKSVEELRDKEVGKISKDTVDSLEITNGGINFSFKKEKIEPEKDKAVSKKNNEKKRLYKWICKGSESVNIDTAKIEVLLQSFDPVTALSFPEIKRETLLQPQCQIVLKTSKSNLTLNIYYKINQNSGYLATSSGSPYVFIIDSFYAEKLFISNIQQLSVK